ncbi:SdrD B-like domain-containing protein [Timonella sp. A28]|uniref:SdrD B-like domain-containing protein n=1 Tax=Timonella sp. A28 TaxID=3442640 RepID=UPI003EBFF043
MLNSDLIVKDTIPAGLTLDESSLKFTATITDLASLTEVSVPNSNQHQYRVRNTARFEYTTDRAYSPTATVTDNIRKVTEGDIQDDGVFKKSLQGSGDVIVPDADGTKKLEYSFTWAPQDWNPADIDVRELTFIDQLDPLIFDIPRIQQEISNEVFALDATAGGAPVSLDHVDVALTNDGRLTIGLTPLAVSEANKTSDLNITFPLTTVKFPRSQTISIDNTAWVESDGLKEKYYSIQSATADTWSAVLEYKKSAAVKGSTQFTQNLRVPVLGNGAPATDQFVYKIDLIPHKGYSGVAILGEQDLLPPELAFIGLAEQSTYTQESAWTAAPGSNNEKVYGTVRASYDEAEHTVSIANDGNKPFSGSTITLYMLVKLKDPAGVENLALSNILEKSRSTSTITFSNKYPLAIAKTDSYDGSETITDLDARFDVTGPNGTSILDTQPAGTVIAVHQKSLVFVHEGNIAPLLVDEQGTYKAVEVTAPKGYVSSDVTYPITVGADGTSPRVAFFNDPIPRVSVGDFVWVDANRDGQQDDGEPGLEGVQLVLKDKDGNPVQDIFGQEAQPVVTDADGAYLFDQLPTLSAGQQYVVHIARQDDATRAVLEPYQPTKEGTGGGSGKTDSSLWEAAADGAGLTAHKNKNVTLDFGFVAKSYALGDYIWVDTNRNGIQDDGEQPLSAVKVDLFLDDTTTPAQDVYGKTVSSVTSDEDGLYMFDNLPTGTYTVRFTLEGENAHKYEFVTPLQGGDALADSNGVVVPGNPDQVFTQEIVLTDDNVHITTDDPTHNPEATEGIDPTWDAGVALSRVSVGNYVWWDANRNGLQDAGEAGIANVKLVLTDHYGQPVTDVFGNPVQPVVTNSSGAYSFTDLPVLRTGESYTVSVDRADEGTKTALKPYVPAPEHQGTDTAVDSSTWKAETTGLTLANQEDRTLDFGFVTPTYAIGDLAWIDANRDGLQDAGEGPLSDVVVKLTNDQGQSVRNVFGAPIAPTVTDASGRYLFDNLVEGTYKVTFELTAEQQRTYAFTINEETPITGNSDGVVQSDEPSQAVTATISVHRDSANLDPDYAGQTFQATQGVDPTWDVGVVRKNVAVGNYVWLDENRNGLQDNDETGIPGVVLTLTDSQGKPVTDVDGQPVAAVKTDAQGKYVFENLPALHNESSYVVSIDQESADTLQALDGLVPTRAGQGSDVSKDSLLWTANSRSNLNSHEDHDLTLDFGFVVPSYAVGDYVWVDTNRDGIQDSTEEPLEGVLVELFDDNGDQVTQDILGNAFGTVRTDSSGYYQFDDLPQGEYSIQFTLTGSLTPHYLFTQANSADAVEGSDSDGVVTAGIVTAATEVFMLDATNKNLTARKTVQASEGIDPTWDAGVVRSRVSFGDYVWLDVNRDGKQDDTEPPLPGVSVVLTDHKGNPLKDVYGKVVAPTTTDTDGKYLFSDLPTLFDGQQYIVEIAPDQAALKGLVPTVPERGKDEGKDSSTHRAHATSDTLRKDGQENLTLDFGFVTPSYALGDYVWVDSNKDGIQDPDEKPLAGVTVELLNAAGKPVKNVFGEFVQPVKTSEGGLYLFDDLTEGRYKVRFSLTGKQSEKYVFTQPNQGKAKHEDSDAYATKNAGIAETAELVLPNNAVSTDYTAQPFVATQGVDSSWDAGVHKQPASYDSGVAGENAEAGGNKTSGELPETGFSGQKLLGVGLLLLVLGGLLVGVIRRRV